MITVQTVDNATAIKIILDEIRPEQYEHLRGKRIRLLEAARECEVEPSNLLRWVERGYVQKLDEGFQMLVIDHGDARFVSDTFRRARELTGSSIKAGWVLKSVMDQLLSKANPALA